MNGLIDFINQNFIEGIISDTSYNQHEKGVFLSTPTPVATKKTPAFEMLLAISALFAAVLVKRR